MMHDTLRQGGSPVEAPGIPDNGRDLQWYAVRVQRRQNGAMRLATLGGEFETYRDRQGRVRKRRIKGTGSKVFLPEHLLRRAGFEVFLPVEKVWRRKNRCTPEKHLVSKPLFVDWLFVGWPADECRWHRLMALDVAVGIMGSSGRPERLPQSLMWKMIHV